MSEQITFYNTDRPHTALDKQMPGEAYFEGKELKKAACQPNPIHFNSAASLFRNAGPLHCVKGILLPFTDR